MKLFKFKHLPVYRLPVISIIAIFFFFPNANRMGSYSVGPKPTGTEVGGAIEGNYFVDNNGAANYTIPIEVPPGRNGIQPNISIQYNSFGGNGLLGKGFKISGFSAISRVAATREFDGFVSAVNFSDTDRFSLDGERLIAVEQNGQKLTTIAQQSAAYHQPDVLYYTHNQSWSRITATHYGAGDGGKTGVKAFTVQLRNGNILTYEAKGFQNNRAISWYMTKHQDPDGNYYTVSYLTRQRNEYLPDEIRYTLHKSANVPSYQRVKFMYEQTERPDKYTHYSGGAEFITSTRLQAIQTYSNEAQVRRYTFEYIQNPQTNLSLLRKINLFDKDGNWIPPTTFKWDVDDYHNRLDSINKHADDNEEVIAQNAMLYDESSDYYKLYVNDKPLWKIEDDKYFNIGFYADINGDRLPDYIERPSTSKYNYLRRAPKIIWGGNHSDRIWFKIPTQVLDDNAVLRIGELIDLSGTGTLSVVQSFHSPSIHNRNLIGGGQLPGDKTLYYVNEPADGPKNSIQLGRFSDIDANGSPDFVFAVRWKRKTSEEIKEVYLNGGYVKPSGIQLPGPLVELRFEDDIWKSYPVGMLEDLNGDGLPDYIPANKNFYYQNPGDNSVWKKNEDFFPYYIVPISDGKIQVQFIDLNNDGLKDLIVLPEKAARTFLNDGTELVIAPSYEPHDRNGRYVDLNGDGLVDYFRYDKDRSYKDFNKVLINNGRGFGAVVGRRYASGDLAWEGLETYGAFNVYTKNLPIGEILDLNGDGIADLLYSIEGSNDNKVFLGVAPRNVIVNIKEGQGKSIDVQYETLAGDKKPWSSRLNEYGYQTNSLGAFAVSRDVTRWDKNPNHFYSQTYTYENPLIVTRERNKGWRGYGTFIVENEQTKERSTFTFLQAESYIGKIHTKVVDYFDPEKQKRSSIDYARKALTTYNYKKVENGFFNVNDVLLTSEETIHYTDDKEVFTSQKAYQYDDYGNITRLKDVANVKKPSTTLYTHFALKNLTQNNQWHLGILDTKKESKSETTDFQNWDTTHDLSWERNTYFDKFPHRLKSKGHLNDQNTQNHWVTKVFEYDDFGNVVSIYDPNDSQTIIKIRYDVNFHAFEEEKRVDHLAQHPLYSRSQYNTADGNLAWEEDPNFVRTFYEYDGFGRRTAMGTYKTQKNQSKVYLEEYDLTNPSEGGTQFKTTKYFWKNDDQNADPNNIASDHYYVIEERDALGRITKEYKQNNDFFSNDDAIKSTEYDGAGRISRVSFLYANQVDVNNTPWTWYDYNAAGQIKEIIINKGSADEKRTQFTYQDSTITRINAPGKSEESKTILTLDEYGNVSKRQDDDGGITDYDYDLLGRVTRITDPVGGVNTTTYNSLGLKSSVENADMGETTFTYNTRGLLESKEDANRNSTYHDYDYLGRLIRKIISPSGDFRKNTTFEYHYDENNYAGSFNMGRLTRVSVTTQDGYTNTTKIGYRYAYDKWGQLKQKEVSLPEGTYVESYKFSPTGQLLERILPDQSKIDYTYDSDFARLKEINRSQYDPKSKSYKDPQQFVSYDDFTPTGQASEVRYNNGVTSNYNYTAEGLLHEHTIKHGGTSLLNNTYHWNSMYDLDQITDNLNAANTQTFQYDGVGRLTQASGIYGKIGYAYDLAGNLTQKDGVGYHYAYMDAGSKKNNRLLKVGDTVLSYEGKGGNITSKSGVDKDGQPESHQYAYNGSNKLVTVNSRIKGNWTENSFEYDHEGRLIWELKKDGSTPKGKTLHISDAFKVNINYENYPSTKTYESYVSGPNGQEVMIKQDADGLALLPSSFKDSGSWGIGWRPKGPLAPLAALLNSVKLWQNLYWWFSVSLPVLLLLGMYFFMLKYQRSRNFANGPRVRWALPPALAAFLFLTLVGPTSQARASTTKLALDSAPTFYYLHHDQVNSVNIITDNGGNMVYQAHYKPFGALHSTSVNSGGFNPEFGGVNYDSNADLYHFGARFYDPQLGRFISPDDQVGADPFSPHAFNRYAYSGNNPVDDYDPSGHFLISLIVGTLIGAVISAAVNAVFQAASGNAFDVGSFFKAMALGAVGGLVAGGVAIVAGPLISSMVVAGFRAIGVAGSVLTDVVSGAITGVVAATAGQAASNLVNQFGFGTDMSSGDWGFTMGMAIGLGALFGVVGGAFEPNLVLEVKTPEIATPGETSLASKFASIGRKVVGYKKGEFWETVKGNKSTNFKRRMSATSAFYKFVSFNSYNDLKNQHTHNVNVAFSTHGSEYTGTLSSFFGLHNGQYYNTKDLLQWSNSKAGVVNDWIHHKKE